MAEQYKTSMPPALDLAGGWTVEFDAVDPTTGATVSGVTVSDVAIQVELVSGPEELQGTFKLVPGPGA